MRVLVLTGVQEELLPIVRRLALRFDNSVRAYRSSQYPDLYAATTGPGIQKRGAIRKLITETVPHAIINAGLVGILREPDHLEAGDRCRLGEVIDSRTRIVYPGGPGRDRLVSVDKPVFAPYEKMDVATDFSARLVDMEAAPLLNLVGQLEEVSTGSVVVFCKVVGDRPDTYYLHQYEHLVRGWHRKSRLEKWISGMRFPGGPWRLRKLLTMKDKALESLAAHTEHVTLRILNHPGGMATTIDSVFIPH
ncbi:MAG: hypothetical protein KDK27_00590 [Leptospiraceae bacterium]|nr:hypothetical protein [Leptospiraceae bacterium]